jgi:arabinofuranan 3-O-arabinosyltransferase
MTASASSSGVADPEGGPRAAIDRDLETAWIAGGRDRDPRLALQWGEPRDVSGLRLRQRLGVPASRPLSVSVEFPDGAIRSGVFDSRGVVAFDEPVRASSMVIRFPRVQEVYSVDPATASGVVLPVGVADLRVLGAVDLQPDPTVANPVDIPCGEGPVLTLGDAFLPTSGTTNSRDLVQALPATFAPCGVTAREAVEGGTVRVLATGGDRWSVRRVVMGDVAQVDASPEHGLAITSWGATERMVTVSSRESPTLLVVRENANVGWVAHVDGTELPRVRPDGWQQGWILPAGDAATVELSMRPALWYQLALLAGLASAIVLIVGAVVAGRRPRRVPEAPLTGASVSPGAQWVTGGTLLVLAAGVWGAVAWGATWAIDRWLPWRAHRAIPVAVGALALLSGAALVSGPWPIDYAGDAWLPGVAVTLAVALAVAPWAGRQRPSRQRAAQAGDE